jgi:hypothetical protein
MADRMQDDLAIRTLTAAYSHAVMRLDAAAAAAVYAEDAVLSAFNFPPLSGRAAIAEGLALTLAPVEFLVQSCSNGMIAVEGDAARASWSVSEWFRMRGKEELGCCFGVYEDSLARLPEGWRFTRRRFHPFYRGTVPSTGKLYERPQLVHDFTPWPFPGPGI